MPKRRSAFQELCWVVDIIRNAHYSDLHRNRTEVINLLLEYANNVAIAKRSREPLPKRPDVAHLGF